jgi:formylglycine-generating enzyme required for sulfatase activity
MTDVTWDEAYAYAHWVGKRLPTLLEWEYAVRGGIRYRKWSGETQNSLEALPDQVNYNSGGAWSKNHDTKDVTPEGEIGAGVRSLCSNVGEWTLTAASWERELPLILATDPKLRGPQKEYWYVEEAFDTQFCNFRRVLFEERNRRARNRGFRCAVSAKVVYDGLEPDYKGTTKFVQP